MVFFTAYGMLLCVMLRVRNQAHKSLESKKSDDFSSNINLSVTKCVKGLLTNWKGLG